jgi:lysozyme
MNIKAVALAGLIATLAYLTLTKSGRDVAGKIGVAIVDFSSNALDVIKNFEGFSATPYRDAQGWSIGYGHFILPGETFTVIDETQATDLLKNDVAIASAAVRDNVSVPLSQNQFDALVSFVYNIGVGNFRGSTLLKKLNAGDYSGAANEFARWDRSQGEVLAVLEMRRAQERDLFMTA